MSMLINDRPMICTCDHCHYTFNAVIASHSKYEIPKRCPDCGKMVIHTKIGVIPAVRKATHTEITEYYQNQQKIIEELANNSY